jgi:hypothetical protein
MSDYVVPCGKSGVHPDGVCRQKLHKNIGGGFHRLQERMAQEEYEKAVEDRRVQFEEQRRKLDLEEKMLGVGMGTHRVIKENRTRNKPRVTPYIPGGGSSEKQGKSK